MQYVFVIPASERLTHAIATIRPIVDGDPKVTRPLYKDIGIAYVDCVVDGMVLDFVRESSSATPRTKSLVETLAKLIKSVAHGLVGQAFGKLTPETARTVLAYLDERASTFEGRAGLGVPIDESAARGIVDAKAAIGSDDLDARRTVLKATMREVIAKAMEYHYQRSFAMLDLGFLTRKAVDVGYDTILRGSLSTIDTSISEGGDPQLTDLATFLGRRLVVS